METPELIDYRAHLLDALDDQPRRATEGAPGVLHVLVNHERIGTLDCARPHPTFTWTARERSIHQLELRNDAGVLIGGCITAEAGQKELRIPVGRGTATVQIRNHFDGGSLLIRYEPAPGWWAQAVAALRRPSAASSQAPRFSAWSMAGAFAQIVLAVGVVALLADRIPSWTGSDDRLHQLEEERAARQSAQEQIDQIHRQLGQLLEAQAGAAVLAQAERERVAQVNGLLDTVSHTQQKMTSRLSAMQDDLLAVKTDVTQEVQSGLRVALHTAEVDRDAVRADIQSVKVVNDTLIKQVALLESRNRELQARVALTALEIAKAGAASKPVTIAKGDAPKDQSAPTQVAEALREADRQAFMFWVAFQDGTTEKSIEELVQELNGIKKGPMKSGWYSVEVNLPKPEPPDRFLESVKRAKIVKSVVTSKAMPPAQ